MAVTLATLRGIIQAEGYNTDTAAQQNELVRAVLRRQLGERRWPWLTKTTSAITATVANAGVIDVAATLGNPPLVNSVRATLGTEFWSLAYLDDVELERRRHTDRAAGEPAYWTIQGTELRVYPIPNATYTLTASYQDLAATLPTADGDTVPWPDAYLDVLTYGVIMRLARRQRDWAGYDRAQQDFERAVNAAMRASTEAQRATSQDVEDWPGWDGV